MKSPIKHSSSETSLKKFYENIIENLPDGIAVIDKDLFVKIFNQKMEELTGFSSRKVLGKPFETSFVESPSLKALINKVLKSGKTYTDFDQILKKRDGTSIPVGITVSPSIDSEGDTQGAVLIVRDLTGIKKLEEALRRSDRLSSLGTLSAGMAHEIKNPLVGIRGAAQLLKEELPGEDTKEYINVILKEVDRINRIVEELLTISHPQKPQFKPVNIHRLLDEILMLEKTAIKGKRIVFVQGYDPSLPHIMGDEKQLIQVFLNLIRNSIESMPDGGEIVLTTRISSQHVVKSHTGTVLVEIRDNGRGVPLEIKEEIFTPFFTTKKKGTGLGLTISNRIVDEHNGRLEIQSDENRGTTARVYLPAVASEAKT